MSAPDVILVGASVRAAAASALRAGLRPWCLDLFGDADLRRMTPWSHRCPPAEYPRGLLPVFRDSPPVPWLYTGGLENHPNLIRAMAELRPLWGNGPDALAASRSPFTVAKLLDEKGLPYLPAHHADSAAVRECPRRWLRKPLRSAGGRDIGFADELPPGADPADPAFYYQQFAGGPAYSAVFLAAPEDLWLLGATRQVIGAPELNARPFQYCGNIGPVALPDAATETLKRIGARLREGCGLRGLFGVDFVLQGETPWVVEVNPRYPASVEVLELARGARYLAAHRAGFDREAPPPRPPERPRARFVAKVIWYAPQRFAFPKEQGLIPIDFDPERPFDFGAFADVPNPGEVIERGWPVCTVLAGGDSLQGCEDFARSVVHHLSLARLE